ncbi:hypothetical protein GCM10010169_21780 [Micromonospora fulviviridis]|nr:hypothetical protein GCM10010169_21780 [Micromonospora fulviviridis]
MSGGPGTGRSVCLGTPRAFALRSTAVSGKRVVTLHSPAGQAIRKDDDGTDIERLMGKRDGKNDGH